MPSNHLILCHLLLLLPSVFPSIRFFSYEPVLCIRWPKYWNFSFSNSPFNEYSGPKVMTNLGSILKSRDITLLTKMHIVQAMVFPVVMYGCDSWNIKKTEHRRTDVFKLWCWRSLLRVPWTERRSNQSILKEINPEYSLEGLMLKLKHQYFGHLIWRANSLEKTQMLGKIEVRRKDWREEKKGMIKDETVGWHHQFNGHEFEQTGRWWRTGKPGMLQSMGSQRVGHNLVTEQYTGQFTTLPNRRMGILWKLLCQTF